MTELLGLAVETARDCALAEENLLAQGASVSETVIAYNHLLAEGEVGELSKMFLEVELMSYEAVADDIQKKVRTLTSRLREIYDLRKESYTPHSQKETVCG